MIKADNIHKSFGGVEVLKGISATFEDGKTNLIIGRSGAGKTIFLKCLLGLETPDQGEIYYDGRALSGLDKGQRTTLRHEIGMVFQGAALFDSFDVEHNVAFPLNMFSDDSKSEIRDRVNRALKRVNLENVNKKIPSELSGGMKKRVAIARAIVMNPKYLFCDEPNSGLDPKTSMVIDNLIKEITEEYNITTVINTHDMNSVMEIGEKIILLKDGYKAWEGAKAEIMHTEDKDIVDFIYSSPLFKKLREAHNRK